MLEHFNPGDAEHRICLEERFGDEKPMLFGWMREERLKELRDKVADVATMRALGLRAHRARRLPADRFVAAGVLVRAEAADKRLANGASLHES